VLVFALVLGVLASLTRQPPLTAFLALLASLFALGVHGQGRRFLAASVAIGLALVGLQVASAVAGQSLDDVLPSSLFLGGAFAVGRLIHHTRSQAHRDRGRAEQAERERDHHAARAAEQERARIARELHDVVAHALSVMVVQASVEARLSEDQTGTAAATLRSIEHLGRDAMSELRRLLGMLTEQGQGPAAAPLPSLEKADALVADLRRAGHEVHLDRRGDLGDLPPGVTLTAYRILQESLTNASRHAPGAVVRVRVVRESDEVHVIVDNDASPGPPVRLDSGGLGLTGMRERVRLYGGRLRTGPRPDGGFTVDARLPVSTAGAAT
jgi:signal transduction histidine kinase